MIRQLITESLGIAVGGRHRRQSRSATPASILLRQIQFPTDIIMPPVFQLDGRALTFSLVPAVASAFLFGLGPAIQTQRV